MSLRLRLALLLFFIVGSTLLAAWWFTGRTVLQPFAREVMEVYLDEVVYIADRVENGTDARRLARELNLEIDVLQQEPPLMRRAERGRARCETEPRGRFTITHCRGRRAPVAVHTNVGYVVVRRELDVGKPGQRISQVLAFIAVVVVGLSAGIAVLVTRPLRTTSDAMQRIAQGDLSHRLPLSGGKELAEVARAYNAMVDRVELLLRTERELMAGISHELRTPLARLRVELEILRDHAVPESRLGAMEKDVEEMDRLIGQLLESSRLSLGDRPLAHDRLELAAVVREAMEKTPLPDHQIRLIEESPAAVFGDRHYLVRVVTNLLENAGKYAPPATEVQVTVRGGSLEIADRGPGVEASELEKIFEPFYRGSRARAQANKSGLGLGLMLARRVVTILGGTIHASNRPGGGLSIRFELPLA